jgi:uncharacterized protein (TIGR03083 family)
MYGDYWAHCSELERQAKAFAEVVGVADPATAIPTCPGWSMADLIRHHGTSQRRVDHVVRHLSAEPVWAKDVATGLPGDVADGAAWSAGGYAAWFAAGAAALLETLRAADPEAEVWTNGRDQHVRYWARRILFEAVVHRADAELAVGATPQIDEALAVDGVDELLTNLPAFPWVAERQRALDPAPVLRFETGSRAWVISPVTKEVEDEPTAIVRAAAGDLLLLVYGRIGLEDDRFVVTGDGRFLAEWLAASAL